MPFRILLLSLFQPILSATINIPWWNGDYSAAKSIQVSWKTTAILCGIIFAILFILVLVVLRVYYVVYRKKGVNVEEAVESDRIETCPTHVFDVEKHERKVEDGCNGDAEMTVVPILAGDIELSESKEKDIKGVQSPRVSMKTFPSPALAIKNLFRRSSLHSFTSKASASRFQIGRKDAMVRRSKTSTSFVKRRPSSSVTQRRPRRGKSFEIERRKIWSEIRSNDTEDGTRVDPITEICSAPAHTLHFPPGIWTPYDSMVPSGAVSRHATRAGPPPAWLLDPDLPAEFLIPSQADAPRVLSSGLACFEPKGRVVGAKSGNAVTSALKRWSALVTPSSISTSMHSDKPSSPSAGIPGKRKKSVGIRFSHDSSRSHASGDIQQKAPRAKTPMKRVSKLGPMRMRSNDLSPGPVIPSTSFDNVSERVMTPDTEMVADRLVLRDISIDPDSAVIQGVADSALTTPRASVSMVASPIIHGEGVRMRDSIVPNEPPKIADDVLLGVGSLDGLDKMFVA